MATVLIAAVAVIAISPRAASGTYLCASTGSPFGPFDITTYEAADYKDIYASTFELAAFNLIAPEAPGFAVPAIETGGREAGVATVADPYIPPALLKSIAFLESGWAQASYDPLVEYGQVGPVLVSPDCGYGLMQITSGMQNLTQVPSLDQAMIGSHFAFNAARGAYILGNKWNLSPEWRPIVGDRDPILIENWYYALWGYNGFAYSNHPLNPSYQMNRVPFSCGDQDDGYAHDRSQYPYQELVLGCVERPPTRTGTLLWDPVPVHLLELNDPAFAEPLATTNWNACSFSLDCAAMDIPTPNEFHSDATEPSQTREQVLGQPVISLSADASITLTPSGPIGSVTFDVMNLGTGVLGYRAVETSPLTRVTDGVAGVALGTGLGGTSGSVTIEVDATEATAGTHALVVTVSSLYPADARDFVINLTVTAGEPTPTPPGIPVLWGDNDCSGDAADPIDSLLVLRHDAGLPTNPNGCPVMGWVAGGLTWGDIDCIAGLSPIDALKTLLADAGVAIEQNAGCPAVDSTVFIVY